MSQVTQLPKSSGGFQELADSQMVNVSGGKKGRDTVVITQPIITGNPGHYPGGPIVPINTVISGDDK